MPVIYVSKELDKQLRQMQKDYSRITGRNITISEVTKQLSKRIKR